MTLGVRKIKLLGAAAVAVLAVSASGCSSLPSVPDWVDPTTWFGSDAPADDGQTPDLASVPDKPSATPDDKQQVAESLATDRKNAQYSADALRGGTEPAAAPPPDMPVTRPAADIEAPAPAKKAVVAAPAPQPKTPTVDRSVAQDPSGAATAPGILPATAPGTAVLPPPSAVQTSALPEPAPQPAAEPAPRKKVSKAVPQPVPAESQAAQAEASVPAAAPVAPPRTRVARAEPAPVRSTQSQLPPGAQPALPPVSPVAPASSVSPSDTELGFKPSSAPPLDPSVSQFVAAPIVNHYRQTAATAGYAQAPAAMASTKKVRRPVAAVGGPERMSGAVVANLDVLQGGRAATPAAYSPAQPGNASAVVYFPNDTTSLSAESKAQVRAAVEQYKASGGQGYIRVVGHSSSRTPNMTPEKHVELVFKKSQDRANAVAQEIIRAGVPASKVLVEAVGDTQPVYYESMPKGEDGNRRAEIFLQG